VLDRLNTVLGGYRNAGTGHDMVRYYFNFHPDAFSEATEFLGSIVSAPAWDQEQFEKEKLVVMNEAYEYQSNDRRLLSEVIMLELLPEGHPLKMYSIGSQKQLKAMTVDDLKELYYSTYGPQASHIVVAGNFDPRPDGMVPLSRDAVIKELRENFFPPDLKNDQHGFKTDAKALNGKKISSIISGKEKQARFVEVGTAQPGKLMELFIEIPEDIIKKNPDAVELFFDYLNQDISGSIKKYLKERGLVADMGAGTMRTNNLSMGYFVFALTDAGAKKRYEIPEIIFSYLKNISANGISQEVMDYLISMNVKGYNKDFKDPDKAASLFSRMLKDFNYDEVMEFEKRFKGVKPGELKSLASKLFSPDKMLMGYMGPDVKSDKKGAVFKRPVVTKVGADLIKKYNFALKNGIEEYNLPSGIELPDVSLEFSKSPLPGKKIDLKARVIDFKEEGISAVLKEKHLSPEGAMYLRLRVPHQSIEDSILNAINLEAFKNRYASELQYFKNLKLLSDLSFNHHGLDIKLEGNREAQLDVLNFIINKINDFTPTEEEVYLAGQKINYELNAKFNDFSAMVAVDTVFSMLLKSDYPSSEKIKTMHKMDYNDVLKYRKKFLRRADISLAAVGDFNRDWLKRVIKKIKNRFPLRLTRKQRENIKNYAVVPGGKVSYWQNLSRNTSPGNYALVHSYTYPENNLRKHAAARILSMTMSREVNMRNRQIKDLGYVHNVSFINTGSSRHLFLYGQTDKQKRWKEIEEGWKSVIDDLMNENLKTDFSMEKLGFFRSEDLVPVSDLKEAVKIFMDFNVSGDPEFSEKILKEVRTLTPEEIYAVGREIFSESPSIKVTATREKPCARFFMSFSSARKRLKGVH